MKILIADDEDIEREHLWMLLETNGHAVLTAVDGVHALNEFNRHPDIDLVITDYKMPGVNGIDLISNMKGIKREVRIWFISSNLTPRTQKLALEVGAERALWKTELELELLRSNIIAENSLNKKA